MDERTQQKQLLRARGICVVIPTYNNAGTIVQVVESTLACCDDVIVVNDGSTDATTSLLQGLEGITLVHYAANRGKGYALRKGFCKAREMGFAYAITLDADGQHYPEHIADFLRANQENPGALIIGSRKLQGVQRSKGSDFANAFSNFWFWVQTGRRLADTQTGYRLYPVRKLYGQSLLTSRYEAELELLVFSSWHGVKLVEIPIDVYYPPMEERVSHFRPTADFARISVLNTVLCFLAVVYGLPLRLWRFLCVWGRTLFSLLFFFVMWILVMPFMWLDVKVAPFSLEKKRLHVRQIMSGFARLVMIYVGIPGTRFSYKRPANLSFDKPRIVICNHQSHLDLMCQLVFSHKLTFLTNDWVWNNPLYGFLIHTAEYYPVSEGLDAMLPKLRSLVERGYSICVFPEGTRSKDCSIGRFHQGAFYLAQQLGLEVLPMYLYGPGKVLPKKTYHLNKGPIYIEVDEPVTQEQLQALGDLKQQTSYWRRHYITKYADICNQIEQEV